MFSEQLFCWIILTKITQPERNYTQFGFTVFIAQPEEINIMWKCKIIQILNVLLETINNILRKKENPEFSEWKTWQQIQINNMVVTFLQAEIFWHSRWELNNL